MKFLIIPDLHGRKPLISTKKFDVIIAVGDFCNNDKWRKYAFEVIKERKANPKCELDWYDLVGKENAKKIIDRSVESGRKILEYLNSFDKPVYLIPGNGDWYPNKDSFFVHERKNHWGKMIKGLKKIHNCHIKIVDGGNVSFIGYGLNSGPEVPQTKKDLKEIGKKIVEKRKKYKENLSKVDKLFRKVKKPVIFISHNVPYNTKLDQINNPASPRNGEHFGSVIAREMIEKYQPLLCISGHMHEHFGKVKIGKTTVVNAGYGTKKNVILEIEKNKIKNLEFIDKS